MTELTLPVKAFTTTVKPVPVPPTVPCVLPSTYPAPPLFIEISASSVSLLVVLNMGFCFVGAVNFDLIILSKSFLLTNCV